MSGTAQERVSPSTGPPGWRGSPASETESDHRLSSWELTGVRPAQSELTLPQTLQDLFWELNTGTEVGSSKTKGLC